MASFSQQLCLTVSLFVILVSIVNSELVCEDKTKSCNKWSSGKKLCDENQKYKKQRFFVAMSKLCRKSCLMCGDDDASLFDTDSRCNSYFRKGYCDMKPHQGFMLKRCKYSCRSTIRSGIMSPGRGNFQRNNPPAQQAQRQQGYWNQQQADSSQQYGQQNAQQYAQQYGQQQYPQNYAQQPGQAQNNGQQHDQQQAQNNGQQQYPQQYAQQNDAQPQQTAGQQQPQAQQQAADQQQPQAQPQGTQSLADLPVQVQALSTRKHKLEKKGKHHHDDMDDDDDDVVNDTDDDMD